MSQIYLVLAVAENNVIGVNNTMPWRLSDDLKNFKKLTSGHCIIMGRKTFESFPKPLPNRPHIIITQQKDYRVTHDNCYVVHSLETALQKAKTLSLGDVFVIGGAVVAQEAIQKGLIDKVWLTKVKANVQGDTFFDASLLEKWTPSQSFLFDKNETNDFDFEIVLLEPNQL